MAVIRIPTLTGGNPIVDREGRPSPEFLRRMNDALGRITALLNAIAAIPEIRDQLAGLGDTIAQAQEAVAAAQEAVVEVQQATTVAQQAIEQIETGDFELQAVRVGGQRFVNLNGELVPEP